MTAMAMAKKSAQSTSGQSTLGQSTSAKTKSTPAGGWGEGLFPQFPLAPDEASLVRSFLKRPALSAGERQAVLATAHQLALSARQSSAVFSAEQVMATYKLSAPEGRMIMELAEALLRVPDAATRDLLIYDKLAPGHWLDGDATGFMRGMKSALELAGTIVRGQRDDGLKLMISRLGVAPVRKAIEMAMRQMGGQFVFAETIQKAVASAAKTSMLFSFDMLGEAARSEADCQRYFDAYANAIHAVGATASADHLHHHNLHQNNGISVKLSALSCHFQTRHWPASAGALFARVEALAKLAKQYNIPLTIDAEEAGRVKPSLHIIAQLLSSPHLQGWQGLGMVVQAYARHAGCVIDWLEAKAKLHQTRIHIRLVKGAYWDSEIKIAQEKGLKDFPVYTAKHHTDLAYLNHAERMLYASAHIHAQFASHNAYTLAAVTCMADRIKPISYELQKLHGMGEAVHKDIGKMTSVPIRIYAPVGRHHDLLAYLVRRILENGANSSFMNQLADPSVAIEDLIADPYQQDINPSAILTTGDALFAPTRRNSRGDDDEDPATVAAFALAVSHGNLPPRPANATDNLIMKAIDQAKASPWQDTTAKHRAAILNHIADAYEASADQFYHLLVQEAGKTMMDAIGELREAVDFCRYYAAEINASISPRGMVVAISPWNFPLAIFTGQVVAALAAGNAVLAKPAEQTPRIAQLAIALMHQAGIPQDALHLVIGGGQIGAQLVASGTADMVVFTGSCATAKKIEAAIATSAKPHAPLIAETGGLNAMIVDGSALLERAVDDILASSFQSAGQRCSALRVLYVQDEIYDELLAMLTAATAEMMVGAPTEMEVDIGPVIDAAAKKHIDHHVAQAASEGRLLWQGDSPASGNYCPASIISVNGIEDLTAEIFGPVLHIARYQAGAELSVVAAINASQYGLTFGLHSRIDHTIDAVSAAIDVGNVYVNRNQIGAVVESQPFGGHGRSGTGPKAGGPLYGTAFGASEGIEAKAGKMPGPSGESNHYALHPRGHVLVLHPDAARQAELSRIASSFGNSVTLAESLDMLGDKLSHIDAVLSADDADIDVGALRSAMAKASPMITPLIMDQGGYVWLQREKHECRDMTASGGNIDLLIS